MGSRREAEIEEGDQNIKSPAATSPAPLAPPKPHAAHCLATTSQRAPTPRTPAPAPPPSIQLASQPTSSMPCPARGAVQPAQRKPARTLPNTQHHHLSRRPARSAVASPLAQRAASCVAPSNAHRESPNPPGFVLYQSAMEQAPNNNQK